MFVINRLTYLPHLTGARLKICRVPKILKMRKHHDPENRIALPMPKPPPAEIIEFPNDPETQPDDATVKHWLWLADEMLNSSEQRKKA